ncbi:MAG: LuxR C-terminal-related transcriptional regulator [Actinomycetota bacterium]|nr:LuxR C-terminal-related transcriptional regulator [Actinomycetota bacterium]
MAGIADHVAPRHAAVRPATHRAPRGADRIGAAREARREAEAQRRRQEALARLAQRRMPLPGAAEAKGSDDLHRRSRADAGMTLVTDAPAMRGPANCACGAGGPELESPVLTVREIEVLRTWLVLETKPAVAQELYISLGTVNTHLTRIRAKYADVGRPAPTKAALVARAVQDGLITLDEL